MLLRAPFCFPVWLPRAANPWSLRAWGATLWPTLNLPNFSLPCDHPRPTSKLVSQHNAYLNRDGKHPPLREYPMKTLWTCAIDGQGQSNGYHKSNLYGWPRTESENTEGITNETECNRYPNFGVNITCDNNYPRWVIPEGKPWHLGYSSVFTYILRVIVNVYFKGLGKTNDWLLLRFD